MLLHFQMNLQQQLKNNTKQELVVIEVQVGVIDESDIMRKEEKLLIK